MSRRRNAGELAEIWFLKDQAIRVSDDDRLNHSSVATTLAAAIRSSEPPCMIGLLAEFGKGKSSTTNLAAAMLQDSKRFDTVTVSADKHAGSERARNLVHGIAGELLRQFDKIKPAEVEEILRPLRQATQVTAKDPTDTPANRFARGRYSYKGLAASLLPFAVVAVVAGGLALLFGAPASTLLTLLAASPVVIWVAAMTFAGTDTPMGSLLQPASLTDYRPRAEAADDIEEVFGRLIDHHAQKRDRRLVVFVDDIDRLAKDDLIDALRALRSLQSVPRGSEPVFVISCNESILRTAIKHSGSAPASNATMSSTPVSQADDSAEDAVVTEETDADSAGIVAELELGERPGDSAHDHPALAFIDKLLTVRIQMPPTMRGDMRRFAQAIIPAHHPLRSASDIDLDRVIGILIHDTVDEPRSVIRLLNRFIASYLLARERENVRVVAPQDITHHTDALAQLCVLLDEFPAFHAEITRDPSLLGAASKVARRADDLTESEKAALKRSSAFIAVPNEPTSIRFRQSTLRRYLTGTVRRVKLPVDLGPILYFAATPGGRVLGAELRSRLISGILSGDSEELAVVLGEVPSDKLDATAGEIADCLLDASPTDAQTFIASVAPNLYRLGDSAEAAADACADLIDRAQDEGFEAQDLTSIIDQTNPARHDMLCARLVRHDDDEETTNRRFLVVGPYLVDNTSIRAKVEPTLMGWLEQLPQNGGWLLAQPWLDVTDHFAGADHAELLQTAVTMMCQSIGSETTIIISDADRLVALAKIGVEGYGPAAPSADKLAASGPITESAFVRLWGITAHSGTPGDALYAAIAAGDAQVADDVRRAAVDLVVSWAEQWTDADHQTEEGTEPTPVATDIIRNLATAVQDPAVQPAFYTGLPRLTATGVPSGPLYDATSDAIVELRDSDKITLAEPLAGSLIEAGASLDATTLKAYVTTLLQPLNTESDPTADAVQMALRLIPQIADVDGGVAALTGTVDSWSSEIGKPGIHDDRTRTEGFKAIKIAAPSLVDERAQQILNQITSYIGDDTRGRLRVLATFPWPQPLVPSALGLIDTHWASLDADSQPDAFHLATRAPDDEPTLARFHDRLVTAIEDDPHGRSAAVAADELHRIDAARAGSIFNASVGRHDRVTQQWKAQDESTVAATLAEHADNNADISRLLDALPDDRRSTAAVTSLQQVATMNDVPADVIAAIVHYCEQKDLALATSTATDALGAEQAAELSALRVLDAARNQISDIDKVASAARQYLAESSTEIAELYGRVLSGTRLPSDLLDELKRLRKDKSPLTAAFDSTYGNRQKRR